MKRNYIFTVVPLVVCLITGGSELYGAFEELNNGSARMEGLAGAFTAVADEPATLFFNPAGIVAKLYPEIPYESILKNSVSLVLPQAYLGGVGIGYKMLNSRHYTEQLGQVSYAIVLKKLKLGLGIKWLKWACSGDEELSQELTSLDLGSFYKASENITVGMTLKDLWQPFTVNPFRVNRSGKSKGVLVPRGQIGVAYTNEDLILAADVSSDQGMEKFGSALGIEKWLLGHCLGLRGGISTRNLVDGVNACIGISFLQGKESRIRLDYGFIYPLVGIKNTQGTHRISLVMLGKGKKRIRKAKIPLAVGIETSVKQISPNGDGKKDKIVITPVLKGGGKITGWKCLITDERGADIRTFSGKGKPQKAISWDGKNVQGTVVEEGKYVVKLEVEEKGIWPGKGKVVASEVKKVTVDVTPPVIAISVDTTTLVSDGSHLVNFSLSANDDSGIGNWQLAILNSEGVMVKSFEGMDVPPENISWEGNDLEGNFLPAGDYVYSLKAVDTVENEALTEEGAITIISPVEPR